MSWRGEHHTPNRYRATSYLIKVRFILHSSFVFGLFHLLAWISVLWHNKYEFDPSLNQLPVHFAVSDALPSSHGRAAVRSYTYFNRKSIAYSSFYLKTLYVEVPKCCFYRHTQACYLLPRIEEMTVTAINAGTLPALSLHRTKRVISLSLSFSLAQIFGYDLIKQTIQTTRRLEMSWLTVSEATLWWFLSLRSQGDNTCASQVD